MVRGDGVWWELRVCGGGYVKGRICGGEGV